MRAKISKWGNSAAVRLPKSALDAVGLAPGQDVEVSVKDGVLELRAPLRRYTIEELFAEAEKHGPLEPPPLIDFGPLVGAEVWPDDDWSDVAPSDAEMGIENAGGRRKSARRR
jgi:antitoxin MazE